MSDNKLKQPIEWMIQGQFQIQHAPYRVSMMSTVVVFTSSADTRQGVLAEFIQWMRTQETYDVDPSGPDPMVVSLFMAPNRIEE